MKKRASVARASKPAATPQPLPSQLDSLATPHSLGYRMPAEWEPHAATWLAWPHEPTDWPGKFDAIPWVFADVARHLQEGERIRVIVSGKREEATAKSVFSRSGVNLKQVDFVHLPTDRSWTRDFLPLGVVRGSGKKRETALVKWKFNGWARYKNHARDEEAGLAVALQLGAPLALPEAQFGRKRARVVLEGGAIDVDGEGSLLCTEECLLDGRQARNAPLGKAGMEAVLRDHLGAEKVLWLGELHRLARRRPAPQPRPRRQRPQTRGHSSAHARADRLRRPALARELRQLLRRQRRRPSAHLQRSQRSRSPRHHRRTFSVAPRGRHPLHRFRPRSRHHPLQHPTRSALTPPPHPG
jgi:hypothetical protein